MTRVFLRIAFCATLPLMAVAEDSVPVTNVLTVLTPMVVTNLVTVVRTNVMVEVVRDNRISETTNLVTRTFKLNNIGAEDLAERFNSMWTGDFGAVWKIGKVAQPFPDANKVMVTAPRSVSSTYTRSSWVSSAET